MIWLQKDRRMSLFNRENKIQVPYESIVGSRWQSIMILYQTEVALRIISRSQYWLIFCKVTLGKESLVLVTKTSKYIKEEILRHQENINLTAGTVLKMDFWLEVMVFTGKVSKISLYFLLYPACRWKRSAYSKFGLHPLSFPPHKHIVWVLLFSLLRALEAQDYGFSFSSQLLVRHGTLVVWNDICVISLHSRAHKKGITWSSKMS